MVVTRDVKPLKPVAGTEISHRVGYTVVIVFQQGSTHCNVGSSHTGTQDSQWCNLLTEMEEAVRHMRLNDSSDADFFSSQFL
jgi:hypothetical protein